MTVQERSFTPQGRIDPVSALLNRPTGARALLVLAHGAGAGMAHPFMEGLTAHLAQTKIATLRYQFPYMERNGRRPDAEPALRATVRAAVADAAKVARGLPLFAGGKSMGGRMTSLEASDEPLPGVRGIVFFGFPLHAPSRSAGTRGAHLARVELPMLFLQGTRDALADVEGMRKLCTGLGNRAALHLIEGGDHSFHVPKRSGRTDEEVMRELAHAVAEWCAGVLQS